jgi:hypothetical protein
MAAVAAAAHAQTPQQLEERRLQYNEEKRREVERSGAPSGSGSDGLFSTPPAPAAPAANPAGNAALAAALDKARRNYEKQPPLPAERNRLLGRWTLDTRKRPANMLEELAGALGNNCALLWGSGVWEFRPKQLVGDSRAPAMVIDTEYRGNANTVAVLPKEFFRLLVFEFLGPDRVRETVTASELATCEFVRVGAAAPAAAGGATPSGVVKAGAPQAPALAAATPSSRPDADGKGCPTNLLDQVGRARLPDAQRAVMARFANVQSRTLGNGNSQLLANGSRCDDPRLAATLYEFSAAGVLQQVTLMWKRAGGPVPSPIFTERASTLARDFNAPAPQQPGALDVTLKDRRIQLRDKPEGVLLEAYGPAR